MRSKIITGLLILLAFGCTSTKKITTSITRSDSVSEHQSTQYKDTTATYHLTGEIARGTSQVSLPDTLKKLSSLIRYLQLQLALKGDKQDYHIVTGLLNSEESHLTCSYAQSWAQVVNGILNHRLEQTDTTITIRLKNAIRLTNYFYYRYKQLSTEKTTIQTSFWAEAWIWIRGILIGLLLAIVIGFILKLKKYVL